MRLAASALSCVAAFILTVSGPEAEQMADRVSELGAIQRVEVEIPDPARIELGAKLGGDGGGDQLARARQGIEPLEQPVHPIGYAGAAGRRELAGLGDVGDREDAGDDFGVDTDRGDMVAKA